MTPSRLATAVAAVAAGCVLASVTGCAGGATAPPASGARTITVTDQRGKVVKLDGPVRRAVTIVIPAASMFAAVDGGVDHLVGMNPSSKQALVDGVLGDFYPQAARISDQVSGTDFVPNVEAVLALNPDVVIQWGDRGSGLTAPLEQAGIPVIGLKYGTQRDLETWVTLFGRILGQEDRARRINASFDAQADHVRSTVGRPDTDPGIMALSRTGGVYSTANASSYTDYYIRLAGGHNVAAGAAAPDDVSIEQILKWDPDIVVLGNFDDTTPQDLYDDPLWRDVTAVRKKQVYKMPLGGYRWDPPSQESALTWRWLAQIAHPELRLGDLRSEIRREYRLFYGHTPTDTQLDGILALDANTRSANYDVFAR